MVTTGEAPTRRERGKAQKREQIFEAARALFQAHDFDEVTTQQIADLADVAVGTLFRYVQSKDELLLMVGNEMIGTRLRDDMAEHLAGLDADADAVTQICHLLEPLIQVAVRHPANYSNYYRCIFFTPAGEHRAKALEHLALLEEQIGQLLSADPARPRRGGISAREAGRILWASMSLELIGLALGHTCYQDVHDALRRHVDLVMGGLIGPAPSASTELV
jgi:AcrR family transcriptional regulator